MVEHVSAVHPQWSMPNTLHSRASACIRGEILFNRVGFHFGRGCDRKPGMMWRNTRCGLFLALLALLAQVGWNPGVPDLPRVDLAVLLADAGAICHISDDAGGHKGPAMPARDCLMGQCCIGTARSVALPAPIIFVPPPAMVPPARFVVAPPATGPPPVRFVIARPRGPPAQA